MDAINYWTFLFFDVIVFLGAYFIINFTLAILKTKFSESDK
jgi:hypothetical protein